MKIDAGNPEHFAGLDNQFDTVVMLNVLEHVSDPRTTLKNLFTALKPGGRAIVLVPQHPSLYGTLDKALEHRERYTRAGLERAMTEAGFSIEKMIDFNRISVLGWWLNGKLLRRKKFSRVQLKALDTIIPVLKRIDRAWPWGGLSIIGIGVKD
jgi:SAM-dependent methyltransferase